MTKKTLPLRHRDPAVDVAAAQRHVEWDRVPVPPQLLARLRRRGPRHQPSQPVMNMTPSTTIGAASNAYVVAPACRPAAPHWNTHAGLRRLTFSVLIWSSGL